MNVKQIALTAFAPMVWGSTYLVTTEFLPPDRPIFVGAMRALPVGLLIVAAYRQLPRGAWWWKSALLGALNIGFFFAMLFLAAYRLPGGVAATLGAIQPLIVALLAWLWFAQRPTRFTLLGGLGGIIGVSLLVLTPAAQLDSIGILAAFAGTISMAFGVVLVRRWKRPVPLLLFTGWQLTLGGLMLAGLSLLIEGKPPALTATNVGGFIYLGAIGTGLAYALWFRGIEKVGVYVSFLGLLSPVVATLLGFIVLNQRLTALQLVGAGLILVSVIVGQWQPRKRKAMINALAAAD